MIKKAIIPKIDNEAELQAYFKSIVPELSETESEHNWSKFSEKFNQLAALCITCNTYANFLEGIKKIRDCLSNSLLTERTTLSLSAMSFVEALAKVSNVNFGPYLELVMLPLLKITGKTNKVFVRKAVATINSIIVQTKLPAIVPYLSSNLSSKNKQIRTYACEFLLNSMNSIESKKLSIHINVIINAIKNGVVDADSGVRTTSKKIFEAFKKLYPDSMPDLVAVLCDTARKNLRITSSPASSVSSASRIRPTAIPRPNPSVRPVQSKALPHSSATQRPIATPTSRIAKPPVSSRTVSTTATRTRPTSDSAIRASSTSSTIPSRTSASSVSHIPSSSSVKRPHPDVSTASQESKYMKNSSASSVPSRANTSSTVIRSSVTASTAAKRPIPQRSSSHMPTKVSSSQSSEASTGSSSRSTGVASILARSKAVIDNLSTSTRPTVPRSSTLATTVPRQTRPTVTPSIPFSTKSRHSTSDSTTSEQPKKNYFKYDKALEVMAKSRPGVEAPKPTTSRTISIPLFNPASRPGSSAASRDSQIRKNVEPSSSAQSSVAQNDKQIENISEPLSHPTAASNAQSSAAPKDKLVEKTESLSLTPSSTHNEYSKSYTSSNKNFSVYDRAVEIMQQTPFPHEFEREKERRNREELDRAQKYLIERSKLPIFKRLDINAEGDSQYHEVMGSIKSKAQSVLESSHSNGNSPLFVYSDNNSSARFATSAPEHRVPQVSSSRDISVYDRAAEILVQPVSGQPSQSNSANVSDQSTHTSSVNVPSQPPHPSSANPISNPHSINVTPRTSYSGIGPVDSPPFHLFESMSPRLGRHSVPSSPRNRHGADMSAYAMGKTSDHS